MCFGDIPIGTYSRVGVGPTSRLHTKQNTVIHSCMLGSIMSYFNDCVDRGLYHQPKGWATCPGAKNNTQGVSRHAGVIPAHKLILITNTNSLC